MGIIDKKINEKLKPILDKSIQDLSDNIIKITKEKQVENQKIMINKIDEIKGMVEELVKAEVKKQIPNRN